MTGIYLGCWQDEVIDNRRGEARPAEPRQFSLPEEFEKDENIAGFVGWDGFFIRDENVPILEMIASYMEKAQEESCGFCTPCRVGTRIVADKLRALGDGRGRPEDLAHVRGLAHAVRAGSLCELGHTSMTALLKLMEMMPELFEEAARGALREERGRYRYRAIATAPCIEACPAHLDIPRYVDAIRGGNYYDSLSIIGQRNPLAGVCGRVCVRPCEFTCRRAELDDPVSIKHLKRFVNDQILSYAAERSRDIEPAPVTHKEKVCVIGAGPCGLTAAFYLRQNGYAVDIIEELEEPGGMSAVGIPDYRLPRNVIGAEIRRIVGTGVGFRYGIRVGRDVSLTELREQYDAILVGIGAHLSRSLGILPEGEAPEGYITGVKFLRDLNLLHHKSEFERPRGDRVVVVGGGNVAMDCARSARRLGFTDVRIVYRRTEKEMPADEEEIEAAKEENIAFDLLTNPIGVKSEEGRVTGLTCVRMELGEPDASGRRRPVVIEGSEFLFECDVVIPAIGQAPDLSLLDMENPLETTRWNTIVVDEDTLMTSMEGVFAGGDCVSGPAALIDAMGHGLHAAHCIDQYLRGDRLSMPENERMFRMLASMNLPKPVMNRVGMKPRRHLDLRPVDERIGDFEEVESGYRPQEAIREAERCLRCYRIAMFVSERRT